MVKIEVVFKDADYGEIIYKILPNMLAKMKDKEDVSKIIQILGGIANVPGSVAKAALSVLPQDVKDDLLVKVITGYSDDILIKINEVLEKQKLPCEIREIWASKV